MASDERDRRFDKALSRHLRSAAPSGEAAKSAGDAAFERGSCPDLETLAAYHERSLLAEEMNFCKEHIVGCAQCQLILTQLEATDAIPMHAEMQEETPVLQASMRAAAAEKSPSAAQPQMTAKTRASRFSTRVRWQWFAPAGAIAAGLLVWVALHENQPLISHNANEIKVAARQEPVSPSSSTPPSVAQGSPSLSANNAPARSQSAADEIASLNDRAKLGAADQRLGKQEYQLRVSPPKAMANKASGARKDDSRAAADSLTATVQGDLDAKAVPTTAQEKVELQTQEQSANTQMQNQNQSQNQSQNQNATIASRAPGHGLVGHGENEKKLMKSAPPAPAPAPAAASGGVSAYNGAASMERVMTSNPRLISPPGSGVIWRAGRAGLLEFSSDSGASWSRQTSGVLVDLMTGMALSDKVCWIVGRVGAILLTTDGGAHWQLIHSPLSEDLGGVRASDALHATIWNARNTKSFETSDGGLTWKPVPNP
jgi:Tfp pilus assembly protein FimT